ncbi:MAG: lipopolysaccharide kinase InaA family protein [Myxococcota bacterium]
MKAHFKIFWSAGDADAQSVIEGAFADGLKEAIALQESAHRRVYSIGRAESQGCSPSPTSLVLKIHHTASGRHPFREGLKRRLGRSAARREWRALESLHLNRIAVPRPRAWGRLPNGDEIIVTDFIQGEGLKDAFDHASPEERLRFVEKLARTILALHATGYRHGDLHLGNLWVGEDGQISLLDLERARSCWHSREPLVDLARLELSLAKAGWKLSRRLTLRQLIGVDARFEGALRRFLRDYQRGRARRVLRVGRLWAKTRLGRLHGLRESSLSADALAKCFEATEADPCPRTRRDGRIRITRTDADGRSIIVKRVAAGGFWRALADSLRGSSAARAFHAGQRLGLLCDRAAQPLAYLEERRFGLPIRSWLLVEEVGEVDLDQLIPETPASAIRVAKALAEWLAEGHSWGLSHRDQKASNIRVRITPGSIRFWLIDLEDLTGPKKCEEDARLLALSQLNASLSDDAFGLDARRAALDHYLAQAPGLIESGSAMSRIVQQSLARQHRWRGHGCAFADSGSAPSPLIRREP